YCAGGYRSSIAASVLRANGFTDVADLIGGYAAWQDRQMAAERPSLLGSRSRRMNSLPLGSRGISAMKSYVLGLLYVGRFLSANSRSYISSSVAAGAPSAGSITALISSPQSSLGMPNTATSPTSGHW